MNNNKTTDEIRVLNRIKVLKDISNYPPIQKGDMFTVLYCLDEYMVCCKDNGLEVALYYDDPIKRVGNTFESMISFVHMVVDDGNVFEVSDKGKTSMYLKVRGYLYEVNANNPEKLRLTGAVVSIGDLCEKATEKMKIQNICKVSNIKDIYKTSILSNVVLEQEVSPDEVFDEEDKAYFG